MEGWLSPGLVCGTAAPGRFCSSFAFCFLLVAFEKSPPTSYHACVALSVTFFVSIDLHSEFRVNFSSRSPKFAVNFGVNLWCEFWREF